MIDAMPNLGQKLVEAARLAVAMHLYRRHAEDGILRQQVTIGGAGPAFFTDEELPMVPTGADRPRRSARPLSTGSPVDGTGGPAAADERAAA